MDREDKNKTRIPALASSMITTALFAGVAIFINNGNPGKFADVDIVAGSIFVFLLSFIIFLLIWPILADR
ncbi:hypothetical protein [Methanohalophilus profundi]|uniref:hypothetical protein n=1 Tax=Methanohalophilus profundi TaxID=2138083 RepID=UPI00101BA799|nr:hypothetical protein [Methanohalophilus profundi]